MSEPGFFEIPTERFPLMLRIVANETGEVLWEQVVLDEGGVEIPMLNREDVRAQVWTEEGVVEWGPRGAAVHSLSAEEKAEFARVLEGS